MLKALVSKESVGPCPGGGGGRGWDSHIKGGGMLVVLLRGVNFGFWSHLGTVLGKTQSYVAMKVSFRVARKEYVLIWSLLGVKISLGHAQIGLL